MIDLGTLGNPRDHYSDDSGATDLNNLGQIVGTSGGRAFLFDGEAMFDLEDLLEPDTGIRELWWAEAINDQGQILAWGWGDSLLSEHFVLTPSHLSQPTYSVPEPSTAAVFATLGGVFLAWRRLRR
jgi:probable HAF family extracellular repeat protein